MIWRPAQSQIPYAGYQTALTEHGRFFLAYRDGTWQFNAPGAGWFGGYETEEEAKEAAKQWLET